MAVSCSAAPAAIRQAGFPDRTGSQEQQCVANGWKRLAIEVAGLPREVLWKGPTSGRWNNGALLVLHGGGGQHHQWCAANSPLVEPQVKFSEMAVARGFAVFLLNSTDRVTDTAGRPCGKVWDDERRDRMNLDLVFIGHMLRDEIPRLRSPGSRTELFITGLSSGGYMTVRASTHFDNLITAFAPVSSGDPYGWHRVCERGTTVRNNVHGAGFDNETGKQIIEMNACNATAYPREKVWDTSGTRTKPAYRVFHHEMDGINDISCGNKVSLQLRAHGYAGEPDFRLRGGRRSLANHLWQDAYSRPVLDFFAAQLKEKADVSLAPPKQNPADSVMEPDSLRPSP